MSGDWLGRGQQARSRPWALEEQLFGPLRSRRGDEESGWLAAGLKEHGNGWREAIIDPRHAAATSQRDYWLCRCEGFDVESPAGRIGVVEGLRFLSRIDQPDLLEVRTGLFGRRVVLVPVAEVESISSREERIVLRATPQRHDDPVSELFVRLRSRLSAGNRLL